MFYVHDCVSRKSCQLLNNAAIHVFHVGGFFAERKMYHCSKYSSGATYSSRIDVFQIR
jgi:hypothetical protein